MWWAQLSCQGIGEIDDHPPKHARVESRWMVLAWYAKYNLTEMGVGPLEVSESRTWQVKRP